MGAARNAGIYRGTKIFCRSTTQLFCRAVVQSRRPSPPRIGFAPPSFSPSRPFRVRLRVEREMGGRRPCKMARSAVGGSIACCPPCRCSDGEPLEQASCPLGAVLLLAPWPPPTPPHLPLSCAKQTPKQPSVEEQPVT